MNEDPWVSYEPMPPRCMAIVVTDSNFDEVADYFDKEWIENLGACAKHFNRKSGERSLALTFIDGAGMPYELTLKTWTVLVSRHGEDFSVIPYTEFRNDWRKRLG